MFVRRGLVATLWLAFGCGEGGMMTAATGSPDAGAGPQVGSVVVTSAAFLRRTSAIQEHTLGVSFAPSPCAQVFDGEGCRVERCRESAPGPTGMVQHAGVVKVTGGRLDATLSPAQDGTYRPSLRARTMLFMGGETLTVAATGDGVPAFTASLMAPSRATLTLPPYSADETARPSVRRSRPLGLAWTGGAGARVEVLLESGPATDGVYRLTCAGPPSQGELSIPSAALMVLPRGPARLDARVVTTATTAAGAWSITFAASTPVLFPNDQIAAFAIDLE